MLYLYWNILMKATGWSRNMENKPYVVWTELTGRIYRRNSRTEFTDGNYRRNCPTELPDGIYRRNWPTEIFNQWSLFCMWALLKNSIQFSKMKLPHGLILPVEFMSQTFKLVFPASPLAKCRKTVLSRLKMCWLWWTQSFKIQGGKVIPILIEVLCHTLSQIWPS